jgi:hypothetical protein
MSGELQYQDHPADPKAYLPQQHWVYEVTPDRGKFRARQLLNGSVLKSTWRDTEEEAQKLCKDWEAVRR